MGAAIALRGDFDGPGLRRLANTTLCGLRLTWGIPNGAKL